MVDQLHCGAGTGRQGIADGSDLDICGSQEVASRYAQKGLDRQQQSGQLRDFCNCGSCLAGVITDRQGPASDPSKPAHSLPGPTCFQTFEVTPVSSHNFIYPVNSRSLQLIWNIMVYGNAGKVCLALEPRRIAKCSGGLKLRSKHT
jgi:hypothetical protein